MRLIRHRAPADGDLVLVRSLCHELRPSMATLAGLLSALETAPAPRRTELARLAAEHVAHAGAILSQAASALPESRERPAGAVPLGDLLPVVAATVPPGSLAFSAGPAASQWPVHPRLTTQILINLVDNAVRYGPGPVRLNARIQGRRIRIAVVDRGGVTTGLRTALRRRTPPSDDRGLGLWVVRRLVAELGGTIRARSLDPTGLAMEVALPRYRT